MVENPHSWAGQPVTPKITYQIFTNASAAQNALEGGQIDIMYLGGGVNSLQQLQSSGQYNSLSAPSGGPRNLKLDTTKPPVASGGGSSEPCAARRSFRAGPRPDAC